MTKPLSPKACLCANLRRAARAVTRDYEEILRPYDLTPGQFSILNVLADADATPIGELAGELGLDRTTLSRNLRPLLAKKLVSVRGVHDHRIRTIEITDIGDQLRRAAPPPWKAVQKRYHEHLGPDDWAALTALLTKLRRASS